MSSDLVYAYLIDATWIFLGSWVVVLLAAYVAAFGQDSSRPAPAK